MMYHFIYPLHETFGFLRVFKYISFRVSMCILTSLLISLVIAPFLIRRLKSFQVDASNIREDVPEAHLKKSGTPSMGGLIIIISMLISVLIWARLDSYSILLACFSTVYFGMIGFLDDYCKLKKTKGITAKQKLLLQMMGAVFISGFLVYVGFDRSFQFPLFKNLSPVLPPVLFILSGVLVIVGSSNAVNLTDGLDGLAIGPVLICALTFVVFAYLAGHEVLAKYLHIAHLSDAGELAIYAAAIFGSGLGFLWFNTYPAQIFMGDVGSLSLGASLGALAILVKQEVLLALVGGVFVLETASVIIQVVSFKTRGKRVFKMAPIHHHFELKGIAEPKVIVRFWIVSIVLALISLVSLKLR